MMQLTRILCGMLLAALMTACGGGGGSAGATPGTGTGGGTGGGSNPGTSTGAASLTAAIVDGAGAATTGVTLGGSFSATATVKDKAGQPVTGRLVTFALSNASLATVTPETALTDSSGVAKVAISVASLTARGAATLSASATVDGTTVTGQTDFAVSASNLALSSITLGNSNLASGGNTSASVTALLNGAPSTGVPVNVTFSASCGRIDGSSGAFSTTTNGSGVASITYAAVNADGTLCSGAVTLTASSAGTDPKTTTLNVAAAAANAITFISATPAQIFVSGSGALEQSVVKFKALSGVTPLPNVSVRFSIITNPGGVGLNASGSTGDVTVTTDSIGEASVTVFSGTIPGPVKVSASLVSDASVFAESQNLSVSSGPPSQRFMSLSVSTFNIEGWSRDGTPTTLTVRLADRQGNPVENGTVVNFTSEGGQVASSCSTVKVNGISSCSVDFMSQNFRPNDGRVSVLAYASGTKDYTDINGNNRYDSGDELKSLGDAYRDDDEDGAYDSGEFVIPRGGTLACTPAGAGWPFPSRAGTCDANLATTVRQQAVILFSSSSPDIQILSPGLATAGFDFTVGSAEHPNLPMPSGTTVAVEVADRTESNSVSCALDKLIGSTVGNISPSPTPTESLVTLHQVTLKGCASNDLVTIKVTSPAGLTTNTTFTFP
jgi:hypothetical protein